MPTDVIMPQMGESIFEGTITKWLKKTGDQVQKDEPLFEISTDKVDAEIPSPVAGVLTEIKIAEGATVQINTVVAVVSEDGAAAAAPPAAAAASRTSAAPVAEPAKPQQSTSVPKANKPDQPAAAPKSTGGTDVIMPQMGESIFEGTITKWLKKVGDTVQRDEPLFEISTDKVDAEIPAPIAGTLIEIRVEEGTTVPINAIVAIIGGTRAESAAAPQKGAPQAAAPSSAAPAQKPSGNTQPALQAGPESPPSLERQRTSPLVRRMAREHNLDLRRISGSGAAGRITKDDVLRHMSEGGAADATQPVQSPAPPQVVPEGLVPLTRMRAIIAQRMVESEHTAPHVYTVFKIDMTRIVRLREREKAAFEQRTGVHLTYMPFIAAAAIAALRAYPVVNASFEPGGIRYHRNINLGVAVAVDWGLIVPVVKQAEERSFADLARAIADFAERARTKRLLPEEIAGNTFTLTNPGVFGADFGTPIINQPDSAILAIGALKKEPVVLTDAEGNDTIAIRSMQHYCLGFDHRLIDGAEASKFMAEFKKTLETWDRAIG